MKGGDNDQDDNAVGNENDNGDDDIKIDNLMAAVSLTRMTTPTTRTAMKASKMWTTKVTMREKMRKNKIAMRQPNGIY